MSPFVAAAIQMRSGTSPEANIETMRDLTAEAVRMGAHYIQTPEMTGAVQKDREALFRILRHEADDPVVSAAAALAREHGVFFHLGSTAVTGRDGRAANRSLIFSPGGAVMARYDKIHMFDVDLDNGESWRESAVYGPGEEAVVADLAIARVGLGICYDIRFPHLFRDLALNGADILCAPAAFTRQTGEAHWHVLQRARAIENGAFVISAAQGGVHEDGRETFGHSLIVNPWGVILAEADGDEPGVVVAEIDPDEVRAARGKIPNLKNARTYGLDIVKAESGRQAAE